MKKTLTITLFLLCLLTISAVSASENSTSDIVSSDVSDDNTITISEDSTDDVSSIDTTKEIKKVDKISSNENTKVSSSKDDLLSTKDDGTFTALQNNTPSHADATSQFKHEAFTIYSPLKSGIYTVNENMDISVKREKWIATYVNGWLQDDYNYIFIEISKDNVVKKSMKINIYPSGISANVGSTYSTAFTPTEIGEYAVRVGFATKDMYYNNPDDYDKLTDVNYVGSFTFNVVEKKNNPNEQTNNIKKENNNGKTTNTPNDLTTGSSTKLTQKTVKITAPKKTFKRKVKTKKYIVTVKSGSKTIKGLKLTLKIKGKKYSATTNNKGKATFKIKKLNKKGKYSATITFSGDKTYKGTSKKVKITIK